MQAPASIFARPMTSAGVAEADRATLQMQYSIRSEERRPHRSPRRQDLRTLDIFDRHEQPELF